MKKMFLASQAKHPLTIERLKNFIGEKFSKLKVAYIPTAANGEYFGSWKSGESIKIVQSLGFQIEIVELESSYFTDIYKSLETADILWFAGGMSGYLLYWIRRCQLEKRIPNYLEQGKIYVGSSAGSMICSHTQNVAEWFIGEEESGANLIHGLGLIGFEIYPHYEEQLLPNIKNLWKQGDGQLRLLKDGDAITIVDDKITTLGDEIIVSK